MDNQIVHVLRALCRKNGSLVALKVLLLAEAGQWKDLQEIKLSPLDYESAESYWKDAMCVDLLRKAQIPTSIDRKAVARATFFSCEAGCAATNVRMLPYLRNYGQEPADKGVIQFITEWRKEISKLLGRLPENLDFGFGQGATLSDPSLVSTIPDKMSSTPSLYPNTKDLLPLWWPTAWGRVRSEYYRASSFNIARGNHFFTVPKSGLTDRGCCKEASLSLFFQLGVGKLLKKRLMRYGINLWTAQAKHRKLAQMASVTGSLATIDMSDASDTIARRVVELLLPPEWFSLLNSLRAPLTRVGQKWYHLEKFSSMGNGFTFELETIIFVTLARTLARLGGHDISEVSCYGDDLIVPSAMSKDTLAALKFFGFTPNRRKTFDEGPFRESCGGDYFLGKPVRAAFLKKEFPDEPQHWIRLANRLRRVAFADPSDPTRWDYVKSAWLRCLAAIPGNIRRLRGPVHLDDQVIHDDEEHWSWCHDDNVLSDVLHHQYDQRYVFAYVPVPSILPWVHWSPSVQLASCTLGLSSVGVTPRESKANAMGYRIKRVPILGTSWLPGDNTCSGEFADSVL